MESDFQRRAKGLDLMLLVFAVVLSCCAGVGGGGDHRWRCDLRLFAFVKMGFVRVGISMCFVKLFRSKGAVDTLCVEKREMGSCLEDGR